MSYSVKEIYYTLQGEGAQAGRAAVFCRFAGCNLWTGKEEDRDRAVCRFCDTDFVGTDGPGGGKFETARTLAEACAKAWNAGPVDRRIVTLAGQASPTNNAPPQAPARSPALAEDGSPLIADRQTPTVRPLVVCTGGEPLLQLDKGLVDALHQAGFEVAIETNGTLRVPEGVDWVCVSPKAGAPVVTTSGDELKLVYPQDGLSPESTLGWSFTHRFLQPMDGPLAGKNTQLALRYCLENPAWRLSVQVHKWLRLP